MVETLLGDEVDSLFDESDPDEPLEVASAGGQPPSNDSRRNGAASEGRPRRRGSSLRRAVERTLAITHLDPIAVAVLALAHNVDAVDGNNDDFLANLAIASLKDGGQARAMLASIVELSTVDDLEAGVIATGIVNDRPFFRRLWAVLRALDPSLQASAPGRATKAGVVVARAVRALSPERLSALTAAYEATG